MAPIQSGRRFLQPKVKIVVAAPFSRYDALEAGLRGRGWDVLRLRGPDELNAESLRAFNPRYVFFPHWSWRIPAEVYENLECVVFHMTDLPFGRGGSPLQNLIVRGAQETMLSALRCVKEIDAGPVYMKRSLSLHGTAEEILVRAAALMEGMIETLARDQPKPEPQVGEPVYFRRRKPEDGNLAEIGSLGQVFDYIRMLDAEGYPKAFIETTNLRLEFNRARFKPGEVTAEVRICKK